MSRRTYAVRSFLLAVAAFLTVPIPADAQDIQWVRQFGTTRLDQATAVAKGPTGVYVTGNTIGVFPGETAVALNDTDAFVRRMDEAGNTLWTRQFGSAVAAYDTGKGIATDQTGVYVVGYTHGALPGQTSAGDSDGFIRKYDLNGNVLWTSQFGTERIEELLGVSADGTAVYVVGVTQGNILGGPQGPLNQDAFIRRYDANGAVVWTRQFGTVDPEEPTAIATDATGIYVVGTTGGALATSVGGRDGFLRKYDSSGNALWTRQFGTNTTDFLYAVAAGALGVYVAGDTTGVLAGQTKVGGLYDGYIIKFDTAGTQQWVRQFGSAADDYMYGLAVGAASVIITGTAGAVVVPGTPYTGSAFIRLYDFDGGVQTTLQFGNGSSDEAVGVAADNTGAYVAGNKNGNALDQIPIGDLDAFALRITLPPPTSLPFQITNFTGISAVSDGTGGLSVGHARIETTAGTTPSGVAIFGFRPSGILVTEVGVPDAPLITSGRIYGEVSASGVVNTGLAISNPNNQTATVTYTLTDTAGASVKTGTRDIGPNQQVAGFLDQEPYSSGSGFQGTLSFTSTLPVGVIALRSLFNERTDFLITTLPVIDVSKGASTGTQVIPHFAVGEGWGTQIILVNPTNTAQTGQVQFFGQGTATTAGAAVVVNTDGVAGSSAAYTVAPQSSKKLTVTAAAPGLSVGSVRIAPTSGGAAPTPMVVFSFKPGDFTFAEAGVPVLMGSAFRMYVESSAAPQIESGIAIANSTSSAATVTLEILTLNGAPVGSSVQRTLPASGQLVGFLSDYFPNLPKPFQGLLRISTNVTISVVALRSRANERGDFLITTTPPTLETASPTATARSFPHFVNGDGWTTQFVLYSGTTGQTATGSVKFYRPDGTPLPVTLR